MLSGRNDEVLRMFPFKKILILFLVLRLLAPVEVFADGKPEVPEEWLSWLESLKKEMTDRGISKKTIQKAYGDNTYYHQRPEVVEQDKKRRHDLHHIKFMISSFLHM